MLAKNTFTKWLRPTHNGSIIGLSASSGAHIPVNTSPVVHNTLRWEDVNDASFSVESNNPLTIQYKNARVPVTVLSIRGSMDWMLYPNLIACAQQLFQSGTGYLLVDLRDVSVLTNAGVIALHNLWRMACGQPLTNIVDGWDALHTLEVDCQQGQPHHCFKVVAPQLYYRSALEERGLTRLFDVCGSVDEALKAF
jgi:hypothetical protein